MGHLSYPRSTILVLGRSSIYSLLPSTLFSQVESLLQNGRLAEAEALLERAEAKLLQASTSSGDPTESLRYLHQCLAFAFLRQTRFREATAHFVKGVVDPRVLVSYFDELRPALFRGLLHRDKDDAVTLQGGEGDSVEVEVWDGVKEYMPDGVTVDDIIATNLVRNYSPYLRPGAIPDSPVPDEPFDVEPLTSDSSTKSGTRTHPATVAMHEVLRGEASELVKNVLAAVLGNADMWSNDVIEVTSTALALLYIHTRDVQSLLTLFAPLPSAPSTSSSRAASRSGSRPPSRPSSTSHVHPSISQQVSIPTLPSHTRHVSRLSQTPPSPLGPVLPLRPEILAPVLAQTNLWGALIDMRKAYGDGEKVVDVLVSLTDGAYVDPSVVDPLEQIFSILTPTRSDQPNSTDGIGFGLSEQERARLVKKWAAWLAGKDVDRGLKLLTSIQPTWNRRPTGAASRGRDKVTNREKDAQKNDELVVLSELRNTNRLAAKQYLEWLVIGRGLGRGGKETLEEGELFEELLWNYVEEVLEYVADEGVGRLWKAKAASYASSPGTTATSFSPPPPPPPPKSDLLASDHLSSRSPPRSPFLSYFSSTTPDSPSKRARIKTLLLLQSITEGKRIIKETQDRIIDGGWDKILSLEMAILHSKIPSPRITLRTLYTLRDTSTAESYASSGGSTGVIGTKAGVSAAEGCGLSDWSGWFARGGSEPNGDEKGMRGDDMLKTLLEVYMEDGDTQQAARFLGSQAKKLDTLEILPLVPTNWPLSALSTYLTRSLRRRQHTAHQGQIVRAICAGQNLAVLESTFEVLREEGAVVEEAVSDDEEVGKGEDGVGRSFDEKVVLHGGIEGKAEVVNVHVGDDEA